MDYVLVDVIALIIGLAAGGAAGYFLRQRRFQEELCNLEAMRTRLL